MKNFFIQLLAEDAVETSVDDAQDTGDVFPDAGDQEETPDKGQEFENLINGEYKEQYHAHTEKMVQGRLHKLRSRVDATDPIIEVLSTRYGLSSTDPAAILKAVNEDRSYLREQADQNGVTEDVQSKLNELKAVKARNEVDEQRAILSRGIEEAKAQFPDFDLDTEMENPDFIRAMQSGSTVAKAYQFAHFDELIGGAMKRTADVIKEKTINDIKARGLRPQENGSSHASAQSSINIKELSLDKINELIERAEGGEEITLR